MTNMTKADRLDRANQLVAVIAAHGRRFFVHHGHVASFQLDKTGHIWFIDDYSKKRIYTHWTRDEWKGFSHGGTLRDLVISLRDYIASGRQLRACLGPWPKSTCDGDLWGYGDSMAEVRKAAIALGIMPAPAANDALSSEQKAA